MAQRSLSGAYKVKLETAKKHKGPKHMQSTYDVQYVEASVT